MNEEARAVIDAARDYVLTCCPPECTPRCSGWGENPRTGLPRTWRTCRLGPLRDAITAYDVTLRPDTQEPDTTHTRKG